MKGKKKERKKEIHCFEERTWFITAYFNDMRIYISPKKERNKQASKQTKWHLRPGKTQISLGIRPVWSEFSLSAWRKLGSLPIHWAHIEDYDQTGQMSRLIWVFAGRKDHFVGLVMRRLIYFRRTFAFKLKCSCWKKSVDAWIWFEK